MPITIHIPTILRPLTGDQKRIEATGSDVRQIIESIDQRHPGIKARLMQDGKAHRFVNIYVNDSDIRFADNLATPVREGDSVTILPAVAGGAGQPLLHSRSPARGRR